MEFRRYLDGSWVPDAASSAYTKVENVDNCSNLVRRSLYLPPRSILLLSGEARYAWQHYIPHHKVTHVVDHGWKLVPCCKLLFMKFKHFHFQ